LQSVLLSAQIFSRKSSHSVVGDTHTGTTDIFDENDGWQSITDVLHKNTTQSFLDLVKQLEYGWESRNRDNETVALYFFTCNL